MNALERFANTATNYLWGLGAPKSLTPAQKHQTKIVAHRGVHESGAIENSRKSFELAVQHNLWGIEFDVRFTSDNVPVIHHDPDCRRLYKCPAVIASTKSQELLSRVPQLLTLEEVVQKFGRKIHLLIEIKEGVTPEQNAILQHILAPLQPMADYHFLTLKPENLENLSFAPKRSVMSVDWMNMPKTIEATIKRGYGAVSGHFMVLTDERLQLCRQQGLITGTGFIETRGALYREIARGIDWIFTNHPLRLKAYLA